MHIHLKETMELLLKATMELLLKAAMELLLNCDDGDINAQNLVPHA